LRRLALSAPGGRVRRTGVLSLEFTSPTMRHAVRVLSSLSAMAFMLR
jgi:hypothetical protein